MSNHTPVYASKSRPLARSIAAIFIVAAFMSCSKNIQVKFNINLTNTNKNCLATKINLSRDGLASNRITQIVIMERKVSKELVINNFSKLHTIGIEVNCQKWKNNSSRKKFINVIYYIPVENFSKKQKYLIEIRLSDSGIIVSEPYFRGNN